MFARCAGLIVACLAAVSCHSSLTSSTAKGTLLSDGTWALRVDRVWNGGAVTGSPTTIQFTDADYQPVSNGMTYTVVVSAQATVVTINGQTVFTGARAAADAEKATYSLDQGTFAGGRFVVWMVSSGLQAELTLYGSGVPIVKSERGALVQVRNGS
jgi:hypothetical protein